MVTHTIISNVCVCVCVCVLVGGKKRKRFAEECVYNVCVCVISDFERLYFMVTHVGLLNTLHNRPIVFLPLRSTPNGVWM